MKKDGPVLGLEREPGQGARWMKWIYKVKRSPEKLTFAIPPDATPDERLAPPNGWDNAADLREGKRIARDIQGALTPNEIGKRCAFDLATSFYHQGLSWRAGVEIALAHAESQLSRADLSLIFDRAYSVQTNPPGLRSLVRPRDHADWIEGGSTEDDDEDISWLEGGQGEWPQPLFWDGWLADKLNNAKLAAHFLDARPAKLIFSNEVFYSLNDGRVWREISRAELAAEIKATDPGNLLDAGRIARIIADIALSCFTTALPFQWLDEPHDAPTPRNLALFQNGVLDTESGILRPHDGRLFATGLPDFDYRPGATCPRWESFLVEVLDGSFVPTLQEFAGYLLVPDNSAEKILLLKGVKRGGKSTIMRVLQHLVGEAHTISRTMQDLASDFGLEGTLNAKLLTIPDASDTEVSRRGVALDRLKSISGNDSVSINRKGIAIVTGKIPARLVIGCNRPLRFLDESGALAARLLIIDFTRSFLGREDRELFTKLRDELPGIAKWALAGLKRLRANGGRFTVGAKGEAAARETALAHSPALRFAKECLIITGDMADRESLLDAFDAYLMWAGEENLGARERRNRSDFATDLIAALADRGVVHGSRRWHDPRKPKFGKGKVVRGFFGVKLKATRRFSVDGLTPC